MKVHRKRWPRSLSITVEDADFYRERSKKTGKLGGALMPAKNSLYRRTAIGGNMLSPRQRHFRLLIAQHLRGIGVSTWPYRLSVQQTVTRARIIGGTRFPGTDGDACLSAIKDALESAGALLNGGQIVHEEVRNHLGRKCSLVIQLDACPKWADANG